MSPVAEREAAPGALVASPAAPAGAAPASLAAAGAAAGAAAPAQGREGAGRSAGPWTPYGDGAGGPDDPAGRRVRVYCLPHAGGAARTYLPWREPAAANGLEIVPVELPGHGTRHHEPPLTRMRDAVDGVLGCLPPAGPFVLLGHSMGARVAYETALRLLRDGGPRPLALVVSGSSPAGSGGPAGAGGPAARTDEELLAWLRALGGTPATALGHKAVARAVARTLRADLGLLARSGPRARPALPYPILALAGAQDHVAPAQAVAEWRALTGADFRYRVLPGGHFFPHRQPERILAAVAEILEPAGGAGHRRPAVR
ncbi:thioesterase II family protein [Actinacidiphila sp. ITFR-21]|uniref:thioesterase II family protein n=1 Tax=Actinacidiphila sp. ITFR-21 TaxID=3075199 RepID=UPI00288B9A83|nr:alpha/beta fold hydrolase [Streptomyces sp. ITFR-21]WNI17850.1 alpha/beta fold hydrolase [Streptomyces sp. ITFR-21]